MISRIIRFKLLEFKYLVFNKTNTRQTKKQESVSQSKEKRNKPTETIPKKDLMVNLIDKGFKRAVLKMLKELKEEIDKVRKMMYEQKGNINKERENLKRKPRGNSRTEKYNS